LTKDGVDQTGSRFQTMHSHQLNRLMDCMVLFRTAQKNQLVGPNQQDPLQHILQLGPWKPTSILNLSLEPAMMAQHSLQQVCLVSIIFTWTEFCLPNQLPVSLFLELKITAQGQ
jgi:hypothetical protein